MKISDLIPMGKANAIKREELLYKCKMLGLATNDRGMRKLIEDARKENCILNMQNGAGYFIPTKDDLPELRHYVEQERDRSLTILSNLKMARNLLEDMEVGRL